MLILKVRIGALACKTRLSNTSANGEKTAKTTQGFPKSECPTKVDIMENKTDVRASINDGISVD